MENKIYYGEYSLKHWIELILSKDIELPPYQRVFVWSKDDVQTLIESFEKKLYIPPITIGAYYEDKTMHNIIIDGQQRLTSIFLAYLGIFPDSKKMKNEIEIIQGYDDGEIEEDDLKNIIEWKFDSLLNYGKTKEEILSNKENFYFDFNIKITNGFFDNTFLGFSYIVPINKDESKVQQKYYSSIFRKINKQGIALQKEEIRESLYYLNSEYGQIFKPPKSLIYTVNKKRKLDFVRYLALASQYAKTKSFNELTKGYKTKLEDYYSAFVEYITENKPTNIKFERITTEKEAAIEELFVTIDELDFPSNYDSIIDIDIYFFGIIYLMIFECKTIDVSKKNEIIDLLNTSIKEVKDNQHIKSPNAYKYLKIRTNKSLEIWRKYVHK